MGMQGAAMAVSLMRTMKRNDEDRLKIQAAKAKKSQDDELFKLKKTNYENQIKESQLKGEISKAEFEESKRQFNIMLKNYNAQNDVKGEQLAAAEEQNRITARANQYAFMKIVPYMQAEMKNGQFTSTQGFKMEKQEEPKTTAVDKSLGELNSLDFDDRKEAEAAASSSLGYRWQEKYPEAVKILDKRFPKAETPDATIGAKSVMGQKYEDSFKIGQIKNVKGSDWEYTGDNKWRKVR